MESVSNDDEGRTCRKRAEYTYSAIVGEGVTQIRNQRCQLPNESLSVAGCSSNEQVRRVGFLRTSESYRQVQESSIPLQTTESCDFNLHSINSTAYRPGSNSNPTVTEFTLELLGQKIDNVVEKVENLSQHVLSINSSNECSGLPTLPCNDRQSYNNLEEWLSTGSNKSILIRMFTRTGDNDDIKEATFQILARIIGNNLAKDMTFTGRTGKIAFRKSCIYDVVKEIVLMKKRYKNSAEKNIKMAVMKWFSNRRVSGDTRIQKRNSSSNTERSMVLKNTAGYRRI